MEDRLQSSRPKRGTFLGIPLQGFGFFTSLLLAFSAAFLAFFTVTTVAIFTLLAWNLAGHHAVSYTASYRWAGAPAFVVVLAVALPLLATLWLRGKIHR
jgi:hypothetical protein